MSDFLDWGAIEYRDVSVGRYAVDEGGYRLFFVRNGKPFFPEKDYWKWLPIPAGISAIGRLNTNTITFDVGIQRPLDSADQHKFRAIITIEISVGILHTKWRAAAMAHTALEKRVKSVVDSVAQQVFKGHDYRDIFFSKRDVVAALTASLNEGLKSGSPYALLSCAYQVEALDASVDSAVQSAQRQIAIESERARNEAIEARATDRDRTTRIADTVHDEDIATRRTEARLKREADETRQNIRLEEEAQAARIRILKAAAEAVPDIDMLIALSDPKAAAEIRKANILKGFQQGRSQGLVEGVKGALRLQDLNPATETTVRIMHETPTEAEGQDENGAG